MSNRFLVLISILGVAACGGDAPDIAMGTKAYSPPAMTVSYAPHSTPSRVHRNILGEIHIGGDVEPRERLDLVVKTDDGFRFYLGPSRDGVGVNRLVNYETDLLEGGPRDRFIPFTVRPLLYVDSDFLLPQNEEIWLALFDSLLLVNDALPPEFQIVYAGTKDSTFASFGEIVVSLESQAGISVTCGAGAVACAQKPSANSALIRVPDDLDTSEIIHPRRVIVHEMLHALGIWGHVDSIEFPDSILGRFGDFIPNGAHIISKIDREILQIMYMSQATDQYNDWGEWSDTSFHMMAENEDGQVQFGVALFNGLPQPWARGVIPETVLQDSGLRGTATWEGALVGFSGPTPIAGDAELQVNMRTLPVDGSEHDLHFRDIYYLSRFESQDRSPDSDLWFTTRNIDYKVEFTGNGFINSDGDGWVMGSVMGADHEHMAGTVKRTDMIGAFGGSRD